ncbi:hypothetical protein [Bradyrhizobium sp. C9]|uniref:hypothetical protein n=1 Tax=Bradyrhizobium sp. C9 TaxID=142585 RepID=UPI0013045163|nr:hypothetical protein [Bradyrhizobium sp. C9]
MRIQVAVYLHRDSKKWLASYARNLGLTQTEVARALIEREQEVGWLKWALKTADPAQRAPQPMKKPAGRLPKRFHQVPR